MTPVANIERINSGEKTWRTLKANERLALIEYFVALFAQGRQSLSIPEFRQLAPDWMPYSPNDILLRNGINWTELIKRYGMDVSRHRNFGPPKNETRCECGAEPVTTREFTCLNPGSNPAYHGKLELCATCADWFDKMEMWATDRGRR